MAPQRPTKKVTIKDIARVCNVSAQTVSRVINERPDVAPATRAAIEQTIAELGYQPSALARSLVNQRSRTLGVIIAGLNYVGVSQTLHGITAQCKNAGYALLLTELPRFDTSNLLPLIEALMAHHVEGIIFAAPELGDNVRGAQAQLPPSCPPIVFLKSQAHPDYTSISIDNYQGAQMAVEHLLAGGRRNIGLIAGPLEWLEARQRKAAWEDTLRAAGFAVADREWSMGNWSSASGEEAFAKLLTAYPEMDAVFVSNDQMALGALHLAYVNKIQVPEQIAVIGFDNMTESAHFNPALTTVNQPLRELGILAVDTLLDQIDAGRATAPAARLLQTELIIRDSA